MVDPRNPRRRKNRRRARRALILPDISGRFESLEPRLLMAVDFWSGQGGDANWSTPGNWQGDTAPSAGDDLDFPESLGNKVTNNDLADATQFGTIEFDDAGYTLGGNAIDLAGGLITTFASGTSTIDNDIALQLDAPLSLTPGSTLALGGDVSGSGYGLTMSGGGTLQFTGTSDSTYTGTTTVNGGTLLVDGSIAGDVDVESGTLGGTGTIGGAPLTVDDTLAPGPVGGTGILTYSNSSNLTLGATSTFEVSLDGTTAGTGYDQLNLTNSSALFDPNGATLAVNLDYLPTLNSSYQIVAQTDPSPITGRFNGLSQFGSFTDGPATFSIGYFNSGVILTVTDVSIPTYTWNGGGGDDNWSDGNNWVGGSAPLAGSNLDFPSGAAQLTTNNDFSTGMAFNNITIDGSGYTLGGHAIDLDGNITTTYTLGTSSVSTDLALQSNTTIEAAQGGTVVLSGAISGSGDGLTLIDGGTLELAGTSANTYTGTTTVDAGTLELGKTAGVDAFDGDLVVGDHTDAATVQLEASDQIPDASEVSVYEGATLDLNGYNESIDGLTVQGAEVSIPTGSTLGVTSITSDVPGVDVTSTIEGDGDLLLNNAFGTMMSITVAEDTNLAVDLRIGTAIVGGNRGIDKFGAGILALSGTGSTYQNNTQVDAGVLQIESSDALGTTNVVVVVAGSVYFDAPELDLTTGFNIEGSGTDDAGALRVISGSTTLDSVDLIGDAGVGAADGATLTIAGIEGGFMTNYNLTVDNGSTGLTILTGDNSGFSELGGSIDVLAGYLRVTNGGALGSGGPVTLEDGSSLELSGGITASIPGTLVAIGGGADAGAADKIINVDGDNILGGGIQLQADTAVNVADGTTLTLSGDITQMCSTDGLTEDGDGTLVLSGTGSYTGDTTIDGGTMQVDGDISASDVVYVNPGATLDGTGTVPAPSVGGDGTVTPGDGGPGILNTGVLGMSPGSIATFDIDGAAVGSGYGQVVVSGSASIVIDDATLSLDLGYTPAIGTQFTLISNDTGQSLIGAFDGLPQNGTFTQGNVTFQITYTGGADDNSVVLTVTDVTYTWSGGDADSGDWSEGDNWVGDMAPTPGARLIFPSAASRHSNVNDFGAGFSVDEIDFQAPGYAITGNAIDLSNGIFTTYTTGSVDFALNAQLEQPTATVALAGGSLDLEGAITQPLYQCRTLHATGSGTLTLGGTGNNAFAHLQADGPDIVLDKGSGYAIWVEGDFTDGSTLTLAADGQLDVGTTTINLYEGTSFNLAGYSTSVYELTLEGATVLVPTGSTLTLPYALSGDLSTDSTTSQITGSGTIDLNGSTLGMYVAEDAGAGVTLDIGTVMTDGAIDKEDAGVLALSAANTFDGNVEVANGTLIVQDASALGSGVGSTTVDDGATLELDSAGSIGESITLGNCMGDASLMNAGGDNHLTGAVTLVGDNTIEVDGGSLTIDGQVTGTGGFTMAGTGELTLTASNTYSGATMISAGTLDITNSGALSTSAVTVDNDATLQLDDGVTITPSSITIAGAGAAAAGALIAATGDNTYAGPITLAAPQTDINVETGATLDLSGNIDEDVLGRQLVSIGDGTLILGGTGSYTSGASILGGTTVVDGSIAASPSGVSILGGATLAGTGTVNPTLFVFSGATVAPGDIDTTGILDSGSAGFVTGSTFHVRLDGTTAGAGYDQLNVTGTVNLDALSTGGATLDIDLMSTPAIGDTFTIINNDGSDPITGTFDGLAQGATITDGNFTFTISYTGGDGNDVVLTTTDVTYTWSGLGSDSNWSTPANWVGDVVPTPGANLVFPTGGVRRTNQDDLAAGFNVYSISTSGAGYTISGNAIDLTNGIATTTWGTVTFRDDIQLQQDQTLSVASGGTLVLDGAISGSGFGLTETGAGTLQFGGTSANTYTGTTQVDAGTLELDKPASVIAVEGNLVIGDNVGTGAEVIVLGDDQIAHTANVTVNQEATLSLDTGVFDQFGDLTLRDATVDLAAGASLYPTVGLAVDAGSDHIGSLIQGAGIFVLCGTLNINVADDPDVAVDLQVSAAMGDPTAGSGAVAKTGAGTMAISGDNTYTGRTYVQSGALIIENSDAVATGDGDLLVFPGGSLVLSGDGLDIPNNFLTISGTGDGGLGAVWVASGSATLSGAMPLGGDTQLGAADGDSLTLSGDISGHYNLFVANGETGSTTLSGDNTFGGSTTVTAGYLEAADSNAFGDPAASTTVTIDNGSSLELSGGVTVPATKSLVVQGTGADDGADDPILNVDGDNTYAGTIQIQANTSVSVATDTTLTLSGDIDQTGSFLWLSKDGAGTLALSGTGSSTLVTIMNAGTTQVDGDFSAGAGVTVNDGTTLSGTGSVAMPVVMDGGIVAPGDGGPGILNTGPLNTTGGSIVSIVIDGATAGTDYSQIVATGGVYLYGATLSLSIGDDFQAANGETFTLIHNVTNSAVGGTFDGLPEGTIFAVQGQAFQISYVGGDGNDVTLTAVPIAVTPTTLVSPAAGSAYSEQLTASGGSGTGYTFSATGLPDGLSISESGLITGTPTTADATPVEVDVTVTDSLGVSTTQDFTMVVNPAIAATPTTVDAPTAGSTYCVHLTGTGGSGEDYTFSATGLPEGLTITDSGYIHGTAATADATPVEVFVTITDGNGMSAVQDYWMTVNQALALTPSTVPTAAVNSSYSEQIGATGGSGSGYTLSATGLPDGLSISESGLITGTPTDNSDSPYTVEVTVTDGDGASATLPMTLAVADALSITPTTLPSPAVGTSYSEQLTGSGGSGSGYTYAATGLPTGLTISPSGLIGGALTTVAGSPFSVEVTITDGDGHSLEIPFSLTGVAGATTTSLSSTTNPAVVGQPFTLTADISASDPESVLVGAGTVSFYDGTTLLGTAPVSDGLATFPVASLPAGPHSLTATFSGSDDFLTSTSTALDLASQYMATSSFLVTGTGTNASPPIAMTIAVEEQGGQVATGQVQFYEDGTLIDTTTLDDSGTAAFAIAAVTAGPHTFSAVYGGDALFTGTTASQTLTVGASPSQAGTVSSSSPQVYYGQTVTLTANFSATYDGDAPMTGTVSFYDGTTFLGTATLVSGNAPTSAIAPADSPAIPDDRITGQAALANVTLSVGSHDIIAVYSGDANYAGATSDTPVTVAVQPATTATTLAAGTDAAGDTILTATITPTSPGTPTLTGTVAFYDGTTLLGTATVVNQVATYNAGVLTAGAHTFSAVFSGGAEATSSGSATVTYTAATGVTVVKIRRYGRHFQPTYVVLTFSGAIDPSRAQDVGSYQLLKLNGRGKPIGSPILIKQAFYNASKDTVTLSFAHRLSLSRRFRLTVLGSTAGGTAGASGQAVNASAANFEGVLTPQDYAGTARVAPIADLRTAAKRG